MADALSILRQFNINKEEIIEKDDNIIFGEVSWPKDAKTNWTIKVKGSVAKEYYTLDSVLFFLKNAQLSQPVYVRRAAAENIKAVRRPDRKGLLAYLNGETATSTSIDKSVPLETKSQIPSQGKRSADDSHHDLSKKVKIDEEQVRQDKDCLAARVEDSKEDLPLSSNSPQSSSSLQPAGKVQEPVIDIPAGHCAPFEEESHHKLTQVVKPIPPPPRPPQIPSMSGPHPTWSSGYDANPDQPTNYAVQSSPPFVAQYGVQQVQHLPPHIMSEPSPGNTDAAMMQPPPSTGQPPPSVGPPAHHLGLHPPPGPPPPHGLPPSHYFGHGGQQQQFMHPEQGAAWQY